MNEEMDKMNVYSPTPAFIESQDTGEFIKILPDTFIVKGGKNDRGFDQGYAIRHLNRKDYILIDVVEAASKEVVERLVKSGFNIRAILISGQSVLKDAYANLETISKDAGGADIYVHRRITEDVDFDVKSITSKDPLMKSFDLDVQELTGDKSGGVLIYSDLNEGMLFTGDNAVGSAYDSDRFTFTREKLENDSDEFAMAENWSTYNKEFKYLFPRKGKPAFEVDGGGRTDILNRLSRGSS
ncbi:MAG: hypothetical protein ACQEWG_16850 [Bacteroidota bacterium]